MPMNHLGFAKWTCLLAVLAGSGLALAAPEPVAAPSNYKGWKSFFLSNGLVELQVLPDLGGCIIQLSSAPRSFSG